jgi:predicted membrane-bound spermidine synthase
MNKYAKSFFVFVMGFFAIAAQTLLFREFITSFASNDIGVALFFSSWFIWIAFSAWLYGKWSSVAAKLTSHINILLLVYIPAFILQLLLIIQARELAGIAAYSLFPIKSMLLMAIIVNFPVSFMTGLIFPAACRWLIENSDIPVSKVYILEAFGSVAGGLAVTILLFMEINGSMIFLLISLLITLAVVSVQCQKSKRWLSLLLPMLFVILIFMRVDQLIMHKTELIKWSKLLPANAFRGSFSTAQAEYLFGNYHNQWLIVRDGAVCTALPDKESGATAMAINLCQQPQTENILIIGSGFNLCHELLKLAQIKHIAWFVPDSQFIDKVNKFIPPEYQINDPKVAVVKNDIRSYLTQKRQKFDTVIINLAAPESSSLNRYFTTDFFVQLKQSLSPKGVVGVKISGGENVLGVELAYIGASVKATLEQVFKKVIIKPGEATWFIASENNAITDNPAILCANFAKIAGIEKVFPPSGLHSLYQPRRSAAALHIYDAVKLNKSFLINRDAEPRVYLYELLLACRQSGIDAIHSFQDILQAGLLPFIITILVFMMIWITYAKGSPTCGRIGECSLLVFISGILAIGTAIILMFLYQTRNGSLFLHIGVISSIFMIGLTSGALLARRLTINNKIDRDRLMFYTITVQFILFAIIAFGKPYTWNHFLFSMAFLLPGFCNGIYFPIAAARLNVIKFHSDKSGSLLENADHLGAAIGASVTGLCLIPLLGTRNTLMIFAVLLLINIPIAIFRIHKTKGAKMNTEFHKTQLTRQIVFTILGTLILLLTFFLTIKMAGKTPEAKDKLNREAIEATTSKQQKKEQSVEELLGPPPKEQLQPSPASKQAPANIENANLKKIKQMIKAKQLSDHEAEFYKKLE